MSELIDAIAERRATRAFSEKKIPEAVVDRIMTAATFAPSCFNNQSWRFLLVTGDAALGKVHEALSSANYWMKKAPLVVIVATKPEFGCQLNDRRDYALFDCGLASENLMLQSVREGLYAHPIAGFDPLKIKTAFGIPEEYIVITLIGIGYPGTEDHLNDKHKAMEHGERQRKSVAEVICRDQWTFTP